MGDSRSSAADRIVDPAPSRAHVQVLQPEGWVGKALPIMQHIDLADSIKSGAWTLVLYHHDCPACARVINGYLAAVKTRAAAARVALIEVPPYGDDYAGRARETPSVVRGRLSNRVNWFVRTPIELDLVDGRVTAVAEPRR